MATHRISLPHEFAHIQILKKKFKKNFVITSGQGIYIYYDMVDNDNIHLTAERIQQVHDMKSAMNRQESEHPPTLTFADEIQQVL